jgi:hypothetical protein
MIVTPSESKPVDQSWIDAMTLRWKASERYLDGLGTDSLPEEHAMRILIKDDIPILIKSLPGCGQSCSPHSVRSPQFDVSSNARFSEVSVWRHFEEPL